MGQVGDARIIDVSTGKVMEAHVLDTPAVREARRKLRRAARSQRALALRILAASTRQASQGRVGAARQTIMRGFGQLILDAALSTLTKTKAAHHVR